MRAMAGAYAGFQSTRKPTAKLTVLGILCWSRRWKVRYIKELEQSNAARTALHQKQLLVSKQPTDERYR